MATSGATREVCAGNEGSMMEGFSNVFDPIGGERPPSIGAANTKLVFRNKCKID